MVVLHSYGQVVAIGVVAAFLADVLVAPALLSLLEPSSAAPDMGEKRRSCEGLAGDFAANAAPGSVKALDTLVQSRGAALDVSRG